jgi:parallel beta-helix repeat protein
MLTNCVILNNTTDYDGGGVHCDEQSDPTFANCTIMGNTANRDGGGVYCTRNSDPTFANCILWDDSPQEIFVDSGNPIVIHCDVQGGWDGVGNIDIDPLFTDPDDGDYHLGDGSPCIDAGNNAAVAPGITADHDGNPRFRDDACTEDTGSGEPPIVDMGAYEFQPPCPCDLDCDGEVVTADLQLLLGAWGTPGGDVDGDGDTDTTDLLALLAAWGECP